MNRLKDNIRIEVQRLLIAGFGYRQITAATGVSGPTIKRLRDDIKASGELPSACPCGHSFGHSGRCEYKRKLRPTIALPVKPLRNAPRYEGGRLKRTKRLLPIPGVSA